MATSNVHSSRAVYGRANSVDGNLSIAYIGHEKIALPNDWNVKPLSAIASIKTGPFGSSLHESDYVEDGTPIITVEHLSEQGIIHKELPMVSDEDRSRLAAYALCTNDIVFSRVGSIDRSSLVSENEDGWLFSGRLLRVRTSDETHAPYLNYHFADEIFKRQVRSVAVGQTMASLNTKILGEVSVILPPLPEQRAIAAILSDIDGMLDALDALIAKKQDIKKATMQQLLTGKTRLPGFSGEWETKRLGDTLTFLTTASNPHSDLGENGEVYYIHYGDVHAHSQPVLDCVQSNLPRIDRKLVERITPVRDGDLIIVDASEDLEGVGKSIEIQGAQDNTVVAGLHTILCRGNSKFWATGFKAYLQFMPLFKFALTRMATGISVYATSKNQLAEVTLPLPEKSEQHAIAAVLSDMDAEIAALEERRDKTSALKQGMMQELLTGRIRLPATE